MERILLLTRSNLKKNKGTTIGLFLLMLVSATLIGLVLLIFLDAYPSVEREATRLDAGDGCMIVYGSNAEFDDEFVSRRAGDGLEREITYNCLGFITASLPFGEGTSGADLHVSDLSAFDRKMARTEVVTEDETIKNDYIYLPYQFYTGGGFNIGDKYSFTVYGEKYTYTVKGFTSSIYFGCNNTGCFEFIVDDMSFLKMREDTSGNADITVIIYDVKDGVNKNKFMMHMSNEILKVDPNCIVSKASLEETISGRTFLALIMAVSFMVVTIIMVIVIALMIANSIAAYIRENMKTIGALKAIGYRGRDIRGQLYFWFEGIALLGSIAGTGLAYISMPYVADILLAQMGLLYRPAFNLAATMIPLIFEMLFVIIVSVLASRKIKRIQPIVALREGTKTHSFKKNHIPLDKTRFGLNLSLGVKTFFTNISQNVITFIVMGLLVFICIIGLLMYENFNRNPKLEILTMETCAGVIQTDSKLKNEVEDYLKSRTDISNIRRINNAKLIYNEEDSLLAYVFDDTEKMNNKDVCYEGRLPKYDNEIAISGKFAKDYGFNVGEEIRLDYGDKNFSYLITGLIQTCNNSGREAVTTEDAASHLMDIEDGWFWFDLVDDGGDRSADTDDILDECIEKYGENIKSTLNFYETIEGNMTIFKSISTIMMALMFVISLVVITLILFLMVKSLIYNKRRDYGIYKALGYRSGSLIFQTAVSFMPAIILSIVVFAVISYFVANPYMSTIFLMFGLMKCRFVIPVSGVICIGVGLAIFSFVIAIWQSSRIRKIESYKMLVGE